MNSKNCFPRLCVPKIDTIRDALNVIDIDGLKQINQHFAKKVKANKVF
jgi:hypothetical protein